MEYRPNSSFGNGNEGVYTKFRYGPVEVFLLDTRWWSWTGPSFSDSTKKSLLGKSQWQWLTEALRGSDATFKLIACGMIWDDKKNSEKDDWGTYMHERDALFAFIGKERISGVVLIGGDIHVSRVLRYKTEEQIGYPLYEFITSPIHSGVIPSLNVPHPDLIRDAVHPHTFMRITVDTTVEPVTLTAEFIDKDGRRLFEDIKVTIEQLSAR
jgi:alkaline phosphatase D